MKCEKCGEEFEEGEKVIQVRAGSYGVSISCPEEEVNVFDSEKVLAYYHPDCFEVK